MRNKKPSNSERKHKKNISSGRLSCVSDLQTRHPASYSLRLQHPSCDLPNDPSIMTDDVTQLAVLTSASYQYASSVSNFSSRQNRARDRVQLTS